jgi:predicted Zn-dependent protease
LVERYNSAVNDFNATRDSQEEVFDQGLYTGENITIYQYNDYNHLVLVLAHELGHALGIDHLEDPSALMHYLLEKQDVNNITLTENDKQAIENICQKATK